MGDAKPRPVIKSLEEEASSDRAPSRRLKAPAKEVSRVDPDLPTPATEATFDLAG